MNVKHSSLIILILCFCQFGCLDSKSVNDHLTSAKQSINNNENDTAVVELKNAITKDKNNAEARFLLGKVYLHQGLLEPAKKELYKSLEFDHAIELVLPLIARVEVQLGSPPSTYSFKKYPINKQTILEINAITGLMLTIQGKYLEALDKFNDVLKSNAKDQFYFELSKAWLAANDEQTESALKLCQKLILKDSEFNDALLLCSMIHAVDEDSELAARSYEKYLSLEQNYYAQLNYLVALINAQEYERGEALIDLLIEKNPNDSFYNEYKAELRFRAEDTQLAIQFAKIVLRTSPDSFKSNYIVGISNYLQQNYEQAYQHLQIIENRLNRKENSYKILQSLKFKLGYNDQAFETIDSIEYFSNTDFDLLLTASWTLLQDNNRQKATGYIDLLDKIETNNPAEIVKRGLLKLSLDLEASLNDFQLAIDIDPNFAPARIALYASYLQKGEFKQAINVAEQWKSEQPNVEGGYIARGLIAQIQLDVPLARQEFNKALELNPKSIGANLHLSTYDLINNDFKNAFNKITLILEQNYNHKIALSRLLTISKESTFTEDSILLIQDLLKEHSSKPNSIQLKLVFAQIYIQQQNLDKALSILRPLEELEVNNIKYMYVYGITTLLDKNYLKAEELFGKIIQQNPRNLKHHLALINTYVLQKKYQQALAQLQNTKSHFKNNITLSLMEVKLFTDANEFDSASIALEEIQPTDKNRDVLLSLKKSLYIKTKDYQKSADVGNDIYQRSKNDKNVYFFVQALRRNNQYELAESTLNEYIKTEGHSETLDRLKAEVQLTTDPERAFIYYQNEVITKPKDIVLLNNLAWSAIKVGKFNLANQHAITANELSPSNEPIMDTLAVSYMKIGKYILAENILKELVNKQPENADFSLHYAEALIYVDKLEKSKTILALLPSSQEKDELIVLLNDQQ